MELNAWHPMRDESDLASIGKLLEELGEATAAASRCLIQDIGESEPVTGKLNKVWLEEELADVLACIYFAGDKFGLDWAAIDERRSRKIEHLRAWHKLLNSNAV